MRLTGFALGRDPYAVAASMERCMGVPLEGMHHTLLLAGKGMCGCGEQIKVFDGS